MAVTSSTRTFTRQGFGIMLMTDRFPKWPDPTASIGMDDIGTSFHGRTLWLTQGPALEAYRTVDDRIKLCIEELGADLYANSPEAYVPHSLGCFMLGKRKSKANPFIVISCSSEDVCKKIKDTIEGHAWWKEFKRIWRGFGRFILSSHPPRWLGLGDREHKSVSEYVFTVATINSLYSAPLLFSNTEYPGTDAQSALGQARARLGGVVYLNHRPLGLTVSHAFKSQHNPDSPSVKYEPESDLFYVDDVDSDDNTDTESDTMGFLEETIIRLQSPRAALTDGSYLEHHYIRVGNIGFRWRDIDDGDWALVEFGSMEMDLHVEALLDRQMILLGKQHLPGGAESLIYAPRTFADLPQQTVSIFIVGRSGKLIRGSVSAGVSLVWLPRERQHARLATILLEESLEVGDCGTWVFDHHGNLYGHIVGGIFGNRVAYMASAVQIVGAIGPDARYRDMTLVPPKVSARKYLRNAISYGYEMDAELLLKNGAGANADGPESLSLLHEAVDRGFEDIVRLLVIYGADVNKGRSTKTPLIRACELGLEETVGLLLEAGAKLNAEGGGLSDPLRAASACGHEGIVKLLLGAGANVNAQGGYYGNALLAATYVGHQRIVQTLIEAGADINAQEMTFGDALQVASKQGHEGIVRMLIDAGADVNAVGGYHGSALQAASQRHHQNIVEWLVDAGAHAHTLVKPEVHDESKATWFALASQSLKTTMSMPPAPPSLMLTDSGVDDVPAERGDSSRGKGKSKSMWFSDLDADDGDWNLP